LHLRVGPDISLNREAIYREWLERELGRNGAARTLHAELVRFQLQRLARRTHTTGNRRFHRCERPDATLTGMLEVASPEPFLALIRRGLGRHRGFGFGMLLLRN
jgi:CRISPR system Cascade subunit CasE